tara:strand:- start:6437 stop:6598 length:162 start_codon:yes stop_codon:yes gene_type:complete
LHSSADQHISTSAHQQINKSLNPPLIKDEVHSATIFLLFALAIHIFKKKHSKL